MLPGRLSYDAAMDPASDGTKRTTAAVPRMKKLDLNAIRKTHAG
jgi:hypothetical protein